MFMYHSDGRSFNVSFKSTMVVNSVGKTVRQTTCRFAIVDNTKVGKARYTNVYIGVAMQNSKDADSRPIGQERAFGNAIKQFSKEERAKMWLQYDPTMKLDAHSGNADARPGKVPASSAVV
jgi:hypothetical protein